MVLQHRCGNKRNAWIIHADQSTGDIGPSQSSFGVAALGDDRAVGIGCLCWNRARRRRSSIHGWPKRAAGRHWIERVGEDGNYRATLADEDGVTVVETDRSGNTLTARFDNAGNLVERDRRAVLPDEPGRRYFEDTLGGDDWHALPDSLKRRYADSERMQEQKLLNRAQEDAAAAREERRAQERVLADQALNEETERKLAAIAAEQEEADRRAAERQARWDRRNEVEEARVQARDLQRQYEDARARGDLAEARRIAGLQDEHHEASYDLLKPTPEEVRTIDEAGELRSRLANEIGRRAADIAEMETSSDLAQDIKEAVTGVRLVQILSKGAELQHDTSHTTRLANKEIAAARAAQALIDERLADPATTDAERAILRDLDDIARVKEEGASRLLTDNARITAAGYGLDATMTATGAGLLAGAGRLGARAVANTAGRVAATEAAQLAGSAVSRTAGVLAEGGLTGLRAVGLDDAARVAAQTTADLAGTAGRVLATDISTPVISRIGGGLSSLGERVAGREAVDAARAFLGKASEVAATEVREAPGKLRQAIAGSGDQASAGVTRVANPVNPPRPPAPQPSRPRVEANELTPDSLTRMADGPASKPRLQVDELTPDGLARMGDATHVRIRPATPSSPRPSWIEGRGETVHQVLDRMYPGRTAPPIHITDAASLQGIGRSGVFEQPLSGGASFARGGTVSEAGNVAIRVKPGQEQFVTFVPTPQGLVPLPSNLPGRSYIPTKHLQYLDPGTAPGLERWLDFPAVR